MKSMLIYLAGPIEGIGWEAVHQWREAVAASAPTGVLLFDPSCAWYGAGPATARTLDYGNRSIIYHCDGVLANLSGEGRGFGTIREIEFATAHDKPVAVCVGDKDIISLVAHDLIMYSTLDGALDALIEVIRKRQDTPPMRGFLLGGPISGTPEVSDEE